MAIGYACDLLSGTDVMVRMWNLTSHCGFRRDARLMSMMFNPRPLASGGTEPSFVAPVVDAQHSKVATFKAARSLLARPVDLVATQYLDGQMTTVYNPGEAVRDVRVRVIRLRRFIMCDGSLCSNMGSCRADLSMIATT